MPPAQQPQQPDDDEAAPGGVSGVPANYTPVTASGPKLDGSSLWLIQLPTGVRAHPNEKERKEKECRKER